MTKRIINSKETSTDRFADLYPFRSRFVNISGNSMHYVDEGEGKTVLMLHGNPTWSFYFRNLIKGLAGEFRAVAPDHTGCGLSDKPGCRTYGYTLKERVNDIDLFIKSLNLQDGEKISLVVHDWGGMIGLAWAVDNIKRVDKIVITNTSGFFLPEDKKFPLRLWLIKYLKPFAVPAVLGFNAFARAALWMAPRKKLSGRIRSALTEPYNSWKNRIATLRFVQDIPLTEKDESYGIVDHVDRNLHLLKKIPMIILWGRHDFVFDLAFLNEWRRRFPEVQAELFDDAGHYLFEDKPGETSAIIRQFLSESWSES